MQKEELEFIDVAEEPKKTEKKRRRAISQKEADKRGQIFAMLLLTVVSVSYTHLDVYKRQVI